MTRRVRVKKENRNSGREHLSSGVMIRGRLYSIVTSGTAAMSMLRQQRMSLM